ncbi:MAG: hypothetical protein ACHQU1_09780 [Gemmatimonadales bacterium]
MGRRARGAAALLASAAFACATGGVRPRFGPEPQAVMMLLDLPASDVTQQLAASVVRVGLPVRTAEPREGYVESEWFDVQARRPAREPFDRLDSIVKLRFFADPAFGHTRLFAECVVRLAWDPSAPPRDLERMPPAGHPGRALLDSVLTVMTPHLVRDTTAAKPGGPPLRERGADTSKAGTAPAPRPVRRDTT